MNYDDLVRKLDGHQFTFSFNEQGEAETIVDYGERIKVETVTKEGSFTRVNYYPDGRKEQEA